ncbi:MAG TPA: hypothetical protein VLC09_16820 [Polyangiaceae bacterium]|nr:hypothetical protein [Polyangiaceae bacterium]
MSEPSEPSEPTRESSARGVGRIVAHVRYQSTVDPDVTQEERDRAWAELAAPMLDRASALGGRLVAWGDEFICVDFSWDALYDALDFLIDAPLALELASGLCHGDVRVLHDAGRVAPAVGAPLREAAQLAELARPGEVLVAPELVRATGERLVTHGEAGKRPGRPEIEAWLLDMDHPLREPSVRPLSVPLEFEAEEPMSLGGPQLARLVSAAEAVSTTSLFPRAMGSALQRHDGASLRELASDLRREAKSPVLAERLDAMAALASGRSGDAIRRLRHAKEETAGDDWGGRCRSTLALAVALSGAGRANDAVLEALEALAHARRGSDERGEYASVRFLAQLSRSLADPVAEALWLARSESMRGPHGARAD